MVYTRRKHLHFTLRSVCRSCDFKLMRRNATLCRFIEHEHLKSMGWALLIGSNIYTLDNEFLKFVNSSMFIH